MAKKGLNLAAAAGAATAADSFVKGAPVKAVRAKDGAKARGKIRVSLDLDPDQHQRLKIRAVKEGKTLLDLLREIIAKEA